MTLMYVVKSVSAQSEEAMIRLANDLKKSLDPGRRKILLRKCLDERHQLVYENRRYDGKNPQSTFRKDPPGKARS